MHLQEYLEKSVDDKTDNVTLSDYRNTGKKVLGVMVFVTVQQNVTWTQASMESER
jgi:hypothetical protein